MKFKDVNIATAHIYGLCKPPYYAENFDYYAWDIMFDNSSTLIFYNIPFIKVGDTEEEGNIFCNQIKENFNKAHINEGDKVAIIFEDSGHVIAIGSIGKDVWIDVTNKFARKTFADLNILPIFLKVY